MGQKTSQVKARFAPSPTGIPHIGNTKAALYNFLFARSNEGKFILRIEDTDQKRIVKEAEEAIFEILSWLGLTYDDKPIYQSKRLDIYKKYVQELLDKQIAHEKDGAIWIKVPEDKSFEWTDKIGNKKIKFSGKDVDEFVILKSDGFPTYHLANVVDDHLVGITDVIRGEEWISSTPKHLYLYESFGWTPPNFAHIPVILGFDKTKLSKRHGAKSILDYKREGFLKEALLNFMALLGWNSGGDKEQMTLDFMIKNFKLEDVNTASPIFDVKKLEWLNGVWIRSLDVPDLRKRLLEFYSKDQEMETVLNGPKAEIIIKAVASRMRTLMEFRELVNMDRQRGMSKEEREKAERLQEFLSKELEDGDWDNEKFLAALKNFSKTENVPFKTIYFLLSGKEQGIGLLELNQLYGKQFFLKNLKN